MTTLYVTEQGTLVRLDGECLDVQVRADKETGRQARQVSVPLIKTDQVVIFGNVTLTAPAVQALLERQIDICYLTRYGRFLGHLTPELSKNSVLRLRQHQHHAQPDRALTLARAFVAAKLANMRTMLMRGNRKLEDGAIAAAVLAMKSDIAAAEHALSIETLLGAEGMGSARYFGVFGRQLRGQWTFEHRSRRPPDDPINALLSFAYTLLTNNVASAIKTVGMDPFIGYLHSSQYGKPALALDLVEEFRPIIADSVVLTVVNNRILDLDDFEEGLGTWRLNDKGRREFLRRFEERLDTAVEHPVFAYQATYRRCLELQVRLLAKFLTEEIATYPPFLAR
jgi:CRISPR-associated protein Cas1